MSNEKMTRSELRAGWSLGLVFALRMLGMFMVLPVLATYGMELQGASASLIGLAIGIYGLAQVLFQIPFGLASDYIGRKPLIVGGLLLFSIGSGISALTDNIWGVILGRTLQGSGAITAAVMALLSDLIRDKHRSKAMMLIGISFGITFAIAMVLGPIITHAIGLKGLFWSITVLALGGILLTLFVVPATKNCTVIRESHTIRGGFRKVFSNPKLIKLNVGIFCLHTILMSSFVAIPPMMVSAGSPPSEQWKIYLIAMLTSFGAVIPAMNYAEVNFRMKRLFLGCIILLLFSELVLLISGEHLWVIFIGIQMFFLAFNIMETLLPSLISNESPEGYRGTTMGVYATSQFLGVAFGGTVGGFLFQIQGACLVFLTEAMITLAWWRLNVAMFEPCLVHFIQRNFGVLKTKKND